MKFTISLGTRMHPPAPAANEAAALKRTLDAERAKYEAEFGRIVDNVEPDRTKNESPFTYHGTSRSDCE